MSIQRNIGCPSLHITLNSLPAWIHPDFPLHPSFVHLSAVHRSDYLRCYLMHIYGGGYTDIKQTSSNWNPFFNLLDASDAYAVGYQEIGPQGVARVGGDLEQVLVTNWQKLIGMCSMVVKPLSPFTSAWFGQLNDTLSKKYAALCANPARHPQDRQGAQFTDGSVSEYPLAWTEILGNILHPLIYKYSEHIYQANMAPSFSEYR